MTMDEILSAMLAKIPDDLDRREGSLIYTALAPVAAQIAELYFYADNIADVTMPDTARGDDLTRKCAELGVLRYPAAPAVRKGSFKNQAGYAMDIPIGSRFSIFWRAKLQAAGTFAGRHGRRTA